MAGSAIHREALLGAIGTAAHVDAIHLDGGRSGEQREVVAGRRQGRKLFGVERVADLRRRGIDNGRLASDQDGLFERSDLDHRIHCCGKANADADAFMAHGPEARKLELHGIVAGRNSSETVFTVGVADGRPRTHHGWARNRDSDTWNDGLRVIDNPPVQGTCAGRDGLSRGERKARQQKEHREADESPHTTSYAWTNARDS